MPTVLFVAHSFPPVGGSGALRALKFTRYLPSFGWRPVVLTVERARIGQPDPSLEAQIPAGLPVYRARSFERVRDSRRGEPLARPVPLARPRAAEAAALQDESQPPGLTQAGAAALKGGPQEPGPPFRAAARIKRRLAATLAHALYFPDAHNTWFPDAFRLGKRAAERHRIDLIYSSAAPFTNHAVALALHLATHLPLVLELRDGWQRWNQAIFPDYPAWRGVAEGALERLAFQHAARVILVTEQSAAAFRAQYPSAPAEQFVVVPNGFDPLDFAGDAGTRVHHRDTETRRGILNKNSVSPCLRGESSSFTVVHLGSLYYGRSCADFLDAVGRLARARPEFATRARVQFIGNLDQTARAEIQAAVARHSLEAQVQCLPFAAHNQALRALRQADVLLLLVNTTPGGGSAVPGKLYEYLAAERPILAITPPGAEGASIIERTRAGVAVSAGDQPALEAALSRLFDQWSGGELRATHIPEEVVRYHRARLTARLASVFEAALREAGTRRFRGREDAETRRRGDTGRGAWQS